MSDRRNPHHPPDVSLLLRAHAEQRWLSSEVIPVVRQIEGPELLPEEQLPAAVAYLEVIWIDAMGRARETEAARCRLDEWECPAHPLPGQLLPIRARRCHAGVRTLREAVARRVAPLLAAPAGPAGAPGYPAASRVCRR
jgi:hypothetical protein